MKPIDYRNSTFADVQARLCDRLLAVLDAWRTHGPCTTKELAERSGIDVLNVRPRTTDLCALGFVALASEERGREGTYKALTDEEALRTFEQRATDAKTGQLTLL